MKGTNIEPFRAPAPQVVVDVESEAIEGIRQLAERLQSDEKPEPVTGKMLEIAESSAVQIEKACDTVRELADAVIAEGRELATLLRTSAEAHEKQVANFADFAKGVTVSIREASSSASTFKQAAE